jgi:hypothetical protein
VDHRAGKDVVEQKHFLSLPGIEPRPSGYRLCRTNKKPHYRRCSVGLRLGCPYKGAMIQHKEDPSGHGACVSRLLADRSVWLDLLYLLTRNGSHSMCTMRVTVILRISTDVSEEHAPLHITLKAVSHPG